MPIDPTKVPHSGDGSFQLTEDLKAAYQEAHNDERFENWVPIFDEFETHMQYTDALLKFKTENKAVISIHFDLVKYK